MKVLPMPLERNLAILIAIVAAMLAPGIARAQSVMAPPTSRAVAATEKNLDRHLSFLKRKDRLIRTGGTRLVFIGDSITDGWRADPQRELLEDYFGIYRPYNIGISGDEVQHVLWRVQHGELDGIDPALAVVMIGTNNLGNAKMSPAETAEGIRALTVAIREKLPRSKILLLAIFPRANRSDDPLRATVAATNARIAGLADDKTVFYLDIGRSFLSPDGSISGEVMPDYLHPNLRGYELWADAIKPTVDRLIGDRRR